MALIEFVQTDTPDGVHLYGALQRPDSSSTTYGLDAVIFHHSGNGNFYTGSFFGYWQAKLVERGSSVFRVNNRGHDVIASPATRHPVERARYYCPTVCPT